MRILAAVALVGAALTAGCGPPALVRGGRPESAILVSTTAAPDEKLAATELHDYLRKISGADVAVTTSPQTSPTLVRLGTFGTDAVRGWHGRRPPADGFALQTEGRTLWIVGGDARGTLYGVYDLLEGELGVRWFMPGDLGEDLVERKTIPLPTVNRTGAPAFAAVRGFIWAGGPGADVWEKRARAAVGPAQAFFGHNWSNIIAPTPQNKHDHPEWFALSHGVRTDQLCSANPEVVRITVEKAREFFARNPDAPLFSISPNDGEGFCEDDRCRAVDRLYGVTDGSLTDRLVHYANQVLEELGQTHPDKLVGILAYVDYTRPPVSVRPHPNFATLVCHTPWEFCHVHALDDPACPLNRRFVSYVQGWTKVCRHVGVYDYYGHFYVFTPWPIVHDIRRDLPFLRRLGVDRFMSETQQHWANQGLNFYLGAKLAWDPGRDTEALLADYYDRFYGRASSPMRRYWERWEQAMTDTAASDGHGGYAWLRMFTPELVAAAGHDLDQAEGLAAFDRERVKQRVAFARQGWRFTEAWTLMRANAERGEWAAAVLAGEEAIRRLEATKGSEPQAFWVQLAVQQTQAMMQPYREAAAKGQR
ncbi:MAG TPA: DUF4838 domain-containing protein [Vicinamibacteria bacterium]|nr:DUF4838 domain-containing protein [Vicinamibacteria bacterium]